MLSMNKKDIARLWSKVLVTTPDSCWVWQASTYKGTGLPYGQFSLNGQGLPAHRALFEHLSGRKLDRWELVCHTCDNPPCCNPAHLFLGTPLDNVEDMRRKKRFPIKRGSECNLSKLTEQTVLEIRQLCLSVPLKELAERFDVSLATISYMLSGKTWKHLGPVEGWKKRQIAQLGRARIRLKEDDVREIRRLASTGVSQKSICSQYGLTSASISQIVNRKQWKDVE